MSSRRVAVATGGGLKNQAYEMLPVADLAARAAAFNPRKISKHDLDALRRSMREFGVVEPVVLNTRSGRVVGGHQRVRAAQAEGIEALPVVRVDLDDVREKQLNLALNRISGEWDDALLAKLLDEMRRDGADLAVTGFEDAEIEAVLRGLMSEGRTDPDAVPDPPPKPITRRGDLILLGTKHRLLCGDATSGEDVRRLMGEERAVLMATDPPYGVAYDNSERPNPGVAKPRVAKPRVANDDLIDGPAMQEFLSSMLMAALPSMKKNAAFYFWHPMLTQGTYVAAAAAAAAGILIHRQIIWVKSGLLLGRGDYHWRHELCFYGWVRGNRPPFYGSRDQDTVWEIGNVRNAERKEFGHATPKPVALWDRPIANHSRADEVLYEPFAGSGTQFVAAERKGRRCFGLEIEPRFCDCIVTRWEQFTGQRATRPARDGKGA